MKIFAFEVCDLNYRKDEMKRHAQRGGDAHSYGMSRGASWGEAKQLSHEIDREMEAENRDFIKRTLGSNKYSSPPDTGGGEFLAIIVSGVFVVALFDVFFGLFVLLCLFLYFIFAFQDGKWASRFLTAVTLSFAIAAVLYGMQFYKKEIPGFASIILDRDIFQTGSQLSQNLFVGLFLSTILLITPWVRVRVAYVVNTPMRMIARIGRNSLRPVMNFFKLGLGFLALLGLPAFWMIAFYPILEVHWLFYAVFAYFLPMGALSLMILPGFRDGQELWQELTEF